RLPAHHPCFGHSHPVDAAGFARSIATDHLEALASKYLALPGNVILPLKTVRLRAVPRLSKNCSCNAQVRVFLELVQQKFEMVLLQRDVCIQIPDHAIFDAGEPLPSRVERMHLGREVALLADGKIYDL